MCSRPSEKIWDDWSNEAGALPLNANDLSTLEFGLDLYVNVTPSSCKLDFMTIKSVIILNSYIYMHPNNLFIIGLMAQSDWKAFM